MSAYLDQWNVQVAEYCRRFERRHAAVVTRYRVMSHQHYVIAHPNSLAAWYYVLGNCKPQHWNAVMTVWRYGMGVS